MLMHEAATGIHRCLVMTVALKHARHTPPARAPWKPTDASSRPLIAAQTIRTYNTCPISKRTNTCAAAFTSRAAEIRHASRHRTDGIADKIVEGSAHDPRGFRIAH